MKAPVSLSSVFQVEGMDLDLNTGDVSLSIGVNEDRILKMVLISDEKRNNGIWVQFQVHSGIQMICDPAFFLEISWAVPEMEHTVVDLFAHILGVMVRLSDPHSYDPERMQIPRPVQQFITKNMEMFQVIEERMANTAARLKQDS